MRVLACVGRISTLKEMVAFGIEMRWVEMLAGVVRFPTTHSIISLSVLFISLCPECTIAMTALYMTCNVHTHHTQF